MFRSKGMPGCTPYVVRRLHRGLHGPSESNRDVDQPWYVLMQRLWDGTCPPERGIAEATRCLENDGDGCWGLPLALGIGRKSSINSVVMSRA